jgi:hypothetical protein
VNACRTTGCRQQARADLRFTVNRQYPHGMLRGWGIRFFSETKLELVSSRVIDGTDRVYWFVENFDAAAFERNSYHRFGGPKWKRLWIKRQ